ncbi:hypothetical protein DS745_14680 [Anaerobacillus alkaliphilus]|uniref:YqgU-like 6-bladed beta-propeller domain-containing protein n=1 Tax=Anaerobacillus alkaliphilus TaxID=1548597 RepID=A0A4Q0VRQ8_9BACI|nr:hypothetical protein [Anaerobacillus alkaliphilus]RXI99465.1 hypothetical protein DS745_14680 [Anaerobacillus alkaliphilus]
MKKFSAILILIFLLSCDQLGETEFLPSSDLSGNSSRLLAKSGIPLSLTNIEQVQSIGASMYSFVTINDWYDNESLLYLTDENGLSIVYKFHILTGEEEIFFQLDQPIISLEANRNFSIFVIEVSTMRGNKELYFLSKKGEVLYTLSELGEHYELYWNPHTEGELTVATVQDDFSIELFHLNLNTKEVRNFEFDHFYIQWMNKEELAYLNWDMYSLSFYATLYTYDVKEQRETKLLDEIITFFSFGDVFLTVSIEDKNVSKSDYIFYDTQTKEEISSIKIPILNTYSEQWWIPFQDYDASSNTFYILQPLSNGDLFDYSEGYRLVSFEVETEKTKDIALLSEDFPLKASPDGQWLVYGYQLENLVDIKKKKIHSLLHW